jgi:hypothetical protein
MANKKIVNGEVVDMTALDIAQREADEIAFVADKEAQAQRATDKANAKAKLIAGEALTEAEADTIVI